jgi:DNA-binding MarR family transcriptional regulator
MSATYIKAADASLTLSELQIMGWISQAGCKGGLTGAGQYLGMHRRQVQLSMARMLLLGLVERAPGPRTEQAVYTLTDNGKTARAAAMGALFGDLVEARADA